MTTETGRQSKLADRRVSAFTLIELLVVVSIIVLLIAILMPSLSRAREQTRRVICASRIRQLGILCVTYANEYRGQLPRGGRDNKASTALYPGVHYIEHTPFISSVLHDYILKHAGPMSTPEPQFGATGHYDVGRCALLDCPNFGEGFQDPQVRYIGGTRLGWVIGYQYLGGHPYVEAINRANPIPGSINGEWTSVQTLSDRSAGELFTDYNNWVPGAWVFVPHTHIGALRTAAGSLGYYNYGLQGIRPEVAGSEGGNVGHLDGSVQWKNIGEMNEYYTYEGAATYPALW